MIFGQVIGQWLYQHWPMDFYASIGLLLILIFVFGFVWFKKCALRREKWSQKFEELNASVYEFIVKLITFHWLREIFKGLFLLKNGGPNYYFDPFKTMFVLAGFVILFRMAVGGRELEGVMIGPNVKNTQIVELKEKKTTGIDKTRPWFSIKKSISHPLNFYELLSLVVFALLFYWRKDFKEGDTQNGFDSLIGMIGKAAVSRISNNQIPIETSNMSNFTVSKSENISSSKTSEPENRTGVAEIELTGMNSRLKVQSSSSTPSKEDPFIR